MNCGPARVQQTVILKRKKSHKTLPKQDFKKCTVFLKVQFDLRDFFLIWLLRPENCFVKFQKISYKFVLESLMIGFLGTKKQQENKFF